MSSAALPERQTVKWNAPLLVFLVFVANHKAQEPIVLKRFQTQKHSCSLWKLLFFIQQYETRQQSETYYCGWFVDLFRRVKIFSSSNLLCYINFGDVFAAFWPVVVVGYREKSHLGSYPAPRGGEVLMNKLHFPQQRFPDIRLLLHANPLSDEMWGFIFTPSHTHLHRSSMLHNTSASM